MKDDEMENDGSTPTGGDVGLRPLVRLSWDALPLDILEKAQEVSGWMKCRGYRNWEVCGLCDRNFAERARKAESNSRKLSRAIESIEEIFMDGDDTYEDWKAMGEIARNALS